MRSRLAKSPFIAIIIVFVAGIILAGSVWMWDSAGSSEAPVVYKLELVSARLTYPVQVGNAGWQIEVIVSNNGNIQDTVDKIYINRFIRECYDGF